MNKKLPAKSNTLTKKIRNDNPWNLGKELGDLIDVHWDTIKAEWNPKSESNFKNYSWFIEFGRQHYLSTDWVMFHVNRHL